jgi:aspartate aminotransferase
VNISETLRKIEGSATAQIFAKAKELEQAGRDIIHLEIGQPDFSPPDIVLEATIQAIREKKTTYTVSRGIEDLRKAIANYYHELYNQSLDYKSEVILTSGAKLAIFASVWTVVNPGDNVIVLNPSWVSYGDIVESLNAEARYLGVDLDFNFDADRLQSLTDDRTKALILNSPSNPTGSVVPMTTLKEIARHCEQNDILLISDEIYSDFVYEGKHNSVMEIEGWRDFALVVNGFSKTFSMTGFRLGYVLGKKEWIDQINKVNQLTASCPVNFAQYGAIVALKEIQVMKDFIQDTMKDRRDFTSQLLNGIGLEFIAPKGAMYAWVRVPSDDSAKFASDLLEAEGVALTPGIAFGPDGEGHVRLCFATSKTIIEEGITRIGRFLGS